VLLSLVAEPLTGVADTAFVARLGAAPLAGLGVAAVLVSSVLWVFNFLGIGTQTQVARALGTGDRATARDANGLALALAAGIGVGLALVSWPLIDPAANFMSDEPAVRSASVVYLEIRLLGVPATLIVMVAFGAFRGMQDMRTPLWIAAASNAANVALDPVLIFGLGPAPALGVAGAAWATTASQWAAAAWSLLAIQRRLGLPSRIHPRAAGALLVVGRDLFLRTGTLLLFLVLATRVATRIGSEAGAAHQAIRQPGRVCGDVAKPRRLVPRGGTPRPRAPRRGRGLWLGRRNRRRAHARDAGRDRRRRAPPGSGHGSGRLRHRLDRLRARPAPERPLLRDRRHPLGSRGLPLPA
jgi:MATE family multidrug resistance protein